MAEPLLKIGELAARAGVSTRTVDYYTGLGLLTPARRTDGGFRLFEAADVDRIALIRGLEAHGLPLDAIAKAFTERSADVGALLERVDADLHTLRTTVESAAPEMHGLLSIIAARAHSLLTLALQIPPDLFLP